MSSSLRFAGPKEGRFTEKTMPKGEAVSSCDGDVLTSRYHVNVVRTDAGKEGSVGEVLVAADDRNWSITVGVELVPC